MKTLTAITNQSTVTAVQNIQALITELNEAVERDPKKDDIKDLTHELFHTDFFELNMDGHVSFFNDIVQIAQNPETKAIAQKLQNLFKLFQD